MSGHDLTRLIGGHHVEGQGAQTIGDRQPGQPPATGDQDRAPCAPGQQWSHGAGVRRVVEDDQHPAIGEQGPVQGSLGVDLDRDVGRRHVQRVQEPPEGGSRGRRLADGVEPVEVDVQLTVRVARRVPAGPLPGQPRLAHATTGTDRDDRRLVRALRRHQAGELGELGGAAREGRGRRQQLTRHCPRGVTGRRLDAGGRQVEHRIGLEHVLVKVAQRRPRLRAQLVGQPGPEPAVALECIGDPPTPVERQHRLGGEPLVPRVLRAGGDQWGHQVRVPAQPQSHVGTP